MSQQQKRISDAIPTYMEKLSQDPDLSEEASRLLHSFFQRGPMSPPSQVAYASVTEVMGLPIYFDDMDISFGAFMANYNWKSDTDFDFSNERVVFSNALFEAFKNPKEYGVNHGIGEFMFLFAHELYHARFRHLVKQKMLSRDYPLPTIVYNIAFDIFINTLLKYNDTIRQRCRNNPLELQLFKYGMRYYEDKKDLADSLSHSVEVLDDLGVTTSTAELGKLNVLLSKELEKFSDDELVELFYALFKDFLESYQSIVDEAIEEMQSQDANGSSSSSASSGDNDSDENEDSTTQDLAKAIQDKLKEKAQNDPEFQKELKRFMGNFSSLPDVEMQVQMEGAARGGVMSPKELAEAVRGRAALQSEVERIEEKYAGMTPGWLRAFADVPPKRPTYLSQLVSFGSRWLGETRATYSPPNKKRPGEILFSSRVGQTLDLAFVIDTSGSMSEKEIEPVLGQIKAILRKASPSSKLHIMFNDADYSHEVIKGRNIHKLKKILERGVQGGGGSVFDKVFKDPIMKKVDAIIFLSDFYIFIPDDLKIRKPLVLLHTESYDQRILNEFEQRSKFSITLPAGRLD